MTSFNDYESFNKSTSKDGEFKLHFDKIDESAAELNNTSLKRLLFNNHEKKKTKRTNTTRTFFWILTNFRKITKKIGFHLTIETADLQDII